MNWEEKSQTEYDKIDLMDYVKVLIKRKWLILVVFLVTVGAVGFFSWYSPKVYKIDTSLEIGKIKVGQVVEEPLQVVGKINSGIYGKFPGMKVSNPANTNLIRIEIDSKDPQEAKNILREINRIVLEDHQEKIKIKKELLENDIERLKRKIDFGEEEKKNLEAQVKILEKTPLKEQTPASQFIFFLTKEKLEAKKQGIEDLYLKINSSQSSLEDIQPTKVMKDPTVSGPIKPRPLLNLVVAGVLGLFLGVALSLGKEWWEKNRT